MGDNWKRPKKEAVVRFICQAVMEEVGLDPAMNIGESTPH